MPHNYKNIQSSPPNFLDAVKALVLATIVAINLTGIAAPVDSSNLSVPPTTISTEFENTTPGRPRPTSDSSYDDAIRKPQLESKPEKPK